MNRNPRWKTFILLLAISVAAISEMELSKLMSDDMVLQCDTESKAGSWVSPFRTDEF